jgi:hypothetical protein
MIPRKTELVAQLIITFCMALIMSGIMGYIAAGPAYFAHWPQTFITAWPIAFLVTQFVGPFAFKIAFRLAPPKRA